MKSPQKSNCTTSLFWSTHYFVLVWSSGSTR